MDAKKDKIKYEDLVVEIEASDNEDAKKIVRMIKEISGSETEEGIEEIAHQVKYAKIDNEIRTAFERQIKVLTNRVERSVSDNFGALIKHLRESQNYSLKDLEALTGISSSYIHRMEKGERKAPTYRIIEKLASALNQDISYFLSVANQQAPEDLLPIEEFLLATDFLIGGAKATREMKESLVDLISKINQSSWNVENKHLETIDIINAVDRYKNITNKK